LINDALREPGILNDAHWVDINNDNFLDLIMVGEWIPIRIFLNENGERLKEHTEQMNLGNTEGIWQTIKPADVDEDGDMDFIVGNIGKNMPFQTSPEQPLRVYAIDFHGNGNIVPIICSYVQGESYPIASLDEIQSAIPELKKKFLKYENYALATIDEIFAPEILERSKVFRVNELESVFLINDGNGKFSLKPLPREVQFSAVQGIVFTDFTGDNIADILLAGNLFPLRTQYGPVDASTGTLLIGKGNGQFRTATQKELGVWIRGDIRDVKLIRTLTKSQIIVTKNSEPIQILALQD